MAPELIDVGRVAAMRHGLPRRRRRSPVVVDRRPRRPPRRRRARRRRVARRRQPHLDAGGDLARDAPARAELHPARANRALDLPGALDDEVLGRVDVADHDAVDDQGLHEALRLDVRALFDREGAVALEPAVKAPREAHVLAGAQRPIDALVCGDAGGGVGHG
jgi:hypothetical protein